MLDIRHPFQVLYQGVQALTLGSQLVTQRFVRMLLPRTRFGSPPSSSPPPLSRKLVKFHLGVADVDNEADDIDSDGGTISSGVSGLPMQPLETSLFGFVAEGPQDNFSDIYSWIERLCQDEMCKTEGSPEQHPILETLSCTTSSTGLGDMLIFLDDNTCNTLQSADPIFIRPSGLGMNTEHLEDCREGRGPGSEKRLDILEGICRSISWDVSAKETNDIDKSDLQSRLSNPAPSYAELRKNLLEWANSFPASQRSQSPEWDRDTMKKALQGRLAKMRLRVIHHKDLMRDRMHAAKIVQNNEEMVRLLEAKRQFSKKIFEECASDILTEMRKEQRTKENQMLDDLLDLVVLYASQKELSMTQYGSLSKRVHLCEDANNQMQQTWGTEIALVDQFTGNLDFLTSESIALSKRALIRARKIIGEDVNPETRHDVLEKRLSDATGTVGMMSNVYNDNKLVDNLAECIPDICDTLITSLGHISKAAETQLDFYSDSYAWLNSK